MRRRSRRRRRRPKLTRRPSLGATIAAAVLVASIVTAALLSRGNAEGRAAALIAYAERARMDPIDLVLWGARSNTIVLLGDIAGVVGPKRIAARAVEALARGPGLDAVVLEVDASLQPVIDRYVDSNPEDVSLLSAEPALLGGGGPAAAYAYLGIYRAVWQLNRTLGPARRIRIVAAGVPHAGTGARGPHALARQYARREEYMVRRVQEAVLRRDPGARVLVFAEGYHVLERGRGRLHFAGGAPIDVTWLGARLAERYPAQVFSILMDGARRSPALGTIAYTATGVADLLGQGLMSIATPFGLPVDGHFDFLRDPIRTTTGPGLRLEILPEGYRLRELADGYIYLHGGGSQ